MDFQKIEFEDDESFWQQIFSIFKTLLPKVSVVLLVTIILPGLLLEMCLQPVGYQIASVVFSLGLGQHPVEFATIVGMMKPFFSWFFIGGLVVFIMEIIGYFSVLHTAFDWFRRRNHASFADCFLRGTKDGIRYGLGLCLLSLFIYGLVHTFIPFFSFLALPIIMAPVFCLAERSGVFAAIYRSLSMDYRIPSTMRFGFFLRVAGVGAVFYLFGMLGEFLSSSILDLDISLELKSKFLQTEIFRGTTLSFFVSKVFASIFQSVMLSLLAIATVWLYLSTKPKSELGLS